MQIQLDRHNLPSHIAVIMDGNGRWAKKKGAARIFGHKNAITAVRETVEGCAELGIKFLTLYAFSTENWGRPKEEVDALMQLLVSTIRKEIKTLQDNKIRLTAIGDIEGLPDGCRNELHAAMKETAHNEGLTLVLALNYSGKWDILQATKKMAKDVKDGKLHAEELTDAVFSSYLSTAGINEPELLIRTSGEMRISNFLLWEMAYTELYFTEVLWPDFRKEELHRAIAEFQKRERRFGKVLDN
jgi:undecaprenyl diphosphate synthase